MLSVGNILRDACALNIPHLAEWALKNGAKVDKRDSFYLYDAAKNGYLDIAKVLVKYGAGDCFGHSKILAMKYGHTEVVDYLCRFKPNIQSQR